MDAVDLYGIAVGDQILVDTSAYGVPGNNWCRVALIVEGDAAPYPYRAQVPGGGVGQWSGEQILAWSSANLLALTRGEHARLHRLPAASGRSGSPRGRRRARWEVVAKVVSEQAIGWLAGAAITDLAWRKWGEGGGGLAILILGAILGLSSAPAIFGYVRDFRRWRTERAKPTRAKYAIRADTTTFDGELSDAARAIQAHVDVAVRAQYDKDEAALRAIVRPKPRLLPSRVWHAILRRVLYLEERRT